MTGTLVVELFYPRPPDEGVQLVFDVLQRLRPDAVLGPADQELSLVVRFPELSRRLDRERSGNLLVVATAPIAHDASDGKRPDLSFTYDWPQASAVFSAATHSIVLTDLLGELYEPPVRIGAFKAVFDAVVAATDPSGTWWPASKRAMKPEDSVSTLSAGLVNVRLFTEPNLPGSFIMDTLGLGVFDIADVQCDFRGLEPGRMAALLYDVANYLIDGATIKDGDTVQGLDSDHRWRVSLEYSLSEPERPVYDLDPGEEYWTAPRGDRRR